MYTTITIKLPDDKIIKNLILREIVSLLPSRLNNVITLTEKNIKTKLIAVLDAQPEVSSIKNGRLRAEFGLVDGGSRIDSMSY